MERLNANLDGGAFTKAQQEPPLVEDSAPLSAYTELLQFLKENEEIEAVEFGGWQGDPEDVLPLPVPESVRGRVLALEQAKPYMEGWSFESQDWNPRCYSLYVWTSTRVLWVGCGADDQTHLFSIPRHPGKGSNGPLFVKEDA